MSVLDSIKHTVEQALGRIKRPNDHDEAMLKLLALKESSPCRDRSANKPKNVKTKNRAKAKASKAAKKAGRK